MELTTMRKALVAAALPVVFAIVSQVTGAGDGPTADQVAGLSTTVADFVKIAVEMGVGGFLVWLVPNKA
jgi:hypothetical protein